MAGSQLKRLKASLKDQGIIGPQQSKKQKRKNTLDAKGASDKRLNRSEALEGIREQFNPFQFKTSARGPKFEVTTSKPAHGDRSRGINGRPGLAKSVGEERRRQTLLVEMQRRNKVGGLVDRRFGENDPSMTLEDKMIERFTREQQRSHKKGSGSMFDLEDDDDEPSEGFLTHGGKALTFGDGDDEALRDDFADEELPPGDESDGSDVDRKRLKRLRLEQAEEGEGAEEDGQPERKKTKKEIYEEIIAKSKLHKYERQAAKEEDGELREELDKELPELQALLFQRRKPQTEAKDAVLIAGVEKTVVDKEYDVRVKQLATDKRAQPAERTKTEEEKVEEGSKRLKELEEQRLRRMRGEFVEDEDEEMDDTETKKGRGPANVHQSRLAMIDHAEDDDEFGLGAGIKLRPTATELGFDDEDDFLIDDDLVASGSDLELDSDDYGSEVESEEGDSEEESEPEDDEFTKGFLTGANSTAPLSRTPDGGKGSDENGVPYTFPCPQSHEELVEAFRGVEVTKLPVAVQRIRALYHPKLESGNKEKLGNFSQALIRHIKFLGDNFEPQWFPTLETLIRHTHSLAKTFPIEVAKGYRACLQEMEQERPLALTVGDLIILTGIGTTFPTSDHFHQVVTPAMLCIGRFLGQRIPQNLADYATGAFLSILTIQYQQLSKRYVPELINFCLNTLCALAPEAPRNKLGLFPVHEPPAGVRIKGAVRTPIRKLNCADCQVTSLPSPGSDDATKLKVAILSTVAAILKTAAESWHSHTAAFFETFQPALNVLEHLTSKANVAHLPPALTTKLRELTATISRLLQLARLERRPLELHHHKPLAIRTVVPKFEDSFDPTKHYDPDRERAELAKLRAEHKRERKGAMRELRKDASFMAREKLRVKKEKDAAYEKKYKRLVAEIQGEEGHAANLYEKEKAARLKKRQR
ncbi:nucleolar protein 14 [Cercophora newfieldiana]|uniref:Nucleolar protein 14 n=1 Tax=Cercophora newfieldiana TaxID=92897 RepID=A0AA39YQ78_9PEZI|nr:nucleolar protein 14 [Cercophora newfieldiana]